LKKRIQEELDILRKYYPKMEYYPKDQWILIPDYPLPHGWNHAQTDVAFQVPNGYPGTQPYGIYVHQGLQHQSRPPQNYKEPASTQPPFKGIWGILSWQAEHWNPSATITAGSNLWTWVRGFAVRFEEGV